MSASVLVGGLCFAFVTVFVVVTGDTEDRKIGPPIGIAVWAAVVLWMDFAGMAATT